jgi:hypothetical protein
MFLLIKKIIKKKYIKSFEALKLTISFSEVENELKDLQKKKEYIETLETFLKKKLKKLFFKKFRSRRFETHHFVFLKSNT